MLLFLLNLINGLNISFLPVFMKQLLSLALVCLVLSGSLAAVVSAQEDVAAPPGSGGGSDEAKTESRYIPTL